MNVLTVSNVFKSFGPLKAVAGVSFDIREGERHGLIGPNGSGKSTLMKCLAGALMPDIGSVVLNGRDISQLSSDARARAGLSIKFQITAVLPALTVFDNVLLAAQSAEPFFTLLTSRSSDRIFERVVSLLERFHLERRSDDRASDLSHGEQQWLEIAMALATRPKLLLLDEPTAGMSVEERRATGELLQEMRADCSILIVEHDLDFVRRTCDRITVLDQGRLLATGTPEQIKDNTEVQNVYLRRV
ncbi:MAG: ABC transporter ATP-binding protein [Mesorhizobium sp.]